MGIPGEIKSDNGLQSPSDEFKQFAKKWGIHDHLRGVPWKDIFKFSTFAAASESWE